MGILDFVRKQFIDVIQWTEEGDGLLAYRYPMQDMEIQYGGQLTVRESQMALFVDQGKIADCFGPGLHKLTTQNIPLITNLKNWDKLFESPFKSDVYFFSTRLQIDQKWGTPQPITIRDKDFGMVRMRAFGIYSYKIADPKRFYTEISGTREQYTVEDLDGQLRGVIMATMTSLFASSQIPFIDMAANQLELGKQVKERLDAEFARLGLMLDSFMVQSVSLPEELQAMLDKRIGIAMVGDLNRYTQFQTAEAIPIAAANEGGLAGIGAGLGVGLNIGNAMAGALASNLGGGGQAAPAPAPAAAAQSVDEISASIEKLHGLLTKGILTQQEFDAKKAELLSRIT
jgi:membrane protease subunit (stomatin/prohibitin family)